MKKIFLSIFAIISLLLPINLQAKDKTHPPQAVGGANYKMLWSTSLKSGGSKKSYFPEMASPYFDGKNLFTGTYSSELYSLNPQNGDVLWSFKSDGPIESKPFSDGSRVFFGNNEGFAYGVNVGDGSKLWTTYIGGEILAQPIEKLGIVYFVTTSREIYAIDAATGDIQWTSYIRGFERQFTMRGNCPVHIDGNTIYIGFADGQVAAVSTSNGETLWSKSFVGSQATFKDVDAGILVDGNYLYIVGYFGELAKVNKKTGETVWSKPVKSGAQMEQDANRVYISSHYGRVVAIDKETGYRSWEVPLNSGAISAPLLVNDNLLVGTETGKFYVLEASTGKVLQTLSVGSGVLSQGMAGENAVYFLSASAKVYALSPASS